MKKNKLLTYFLYFICFVSQAQNNIYQGIKKLPITDEEKFFKIDSLLQKNLKDRDTLNFLIVSHKYANWHYNNDRVSKAIDALSISIDYHNLDIDLLQTKLYKRGHWYSLLNQLDDCIEDNKLIIHLNPDTNWATLAYIKIAESLNSKGDYILAAKNLEIAEKRLRNIGDYNALIDLYTFSYNTYSKIRTTEATNKLLSNLNAADSITQLYEIETSKKFTVKRVLGSFYSIYKNRNIKKGGLYFNQALQLAFKMEDSVGISNSYNGLGRLYDEFTPEKSIYYNNLALSYCPKNNAYLKSVIEANLGLNYIHLKKYDTGIEHLQEALSYMTGNRFDFLSSNNKKNFLSKSLDNNNLWSAVRWLGEAYDKKYEHTNARKDLDSALIYYKLTDYTFDLYTERGKLTNSKLYWRNEASETYSRGMRALFKAKAIEEAFHFMEKNKALLLRNETKKIRAFKEEQLPIELVKKEQRLQLQLANTTNTSQFPIIIDSLEQTQKEINELLPELRVLEKQSDIVKLQDIQSKLSKDQAIIEYHISTDDTFGIYPNPDVGYGIVITKENNVIFEIASLRQTKIAIKAFLKMLTNAQRTRKDVTDLDSVAYTLYKQLMPDTITHLIKDKSLTIIPDNYLSKIPFEALTASDKTPNDYLIKHHRINYKYSYTFHHNQTINRKEQSSDYFAFAPVNFEDSKLPSLLNSTNEIATLNNYFKGTNYSNSQATKATFLEQLNKGNIIHLATHANANDSIAPWISLYDEKIYLNELSLHQNNAALVVLSACNTSNGDVLTGEGVMSLARGFFYGGAQSTVSSLWSIDDKSTSYIVNQFYQNLSQSQDKSIALRNAKLAYIKAHSGSEASPYYWASLILIGDTSPIPQQGYNLYYFVFGTLLFIVVVFVMFVMLSQKRKKKLISS